MDISPIAIAKNLLESYRDRLSFVLEGNELPPDVIQEIVTNMQLESGIYLSLNPRYEQTNQPFANFVRQHDLPDPLVSLLPKLSERGLYTHQKQGVLSILSNQHTVISTGTGSGKTETFLIPIISHCLRSSALGVKAIIIYPMNALAGDQIERIGEYTRNTKITFGLFTSATPEDASAEKIERKFANQLIYRNEIRANPPDILITNYVMLDRMLTRDKDQRIFTESTHSMQYLVLDELHTYVGTKAAHLKHLLARLNYYLANTPVYVGTSATLIRGTAGKEKLDQFIRDLLGIEDYTFIEAVEEKRLIAPVKPAPILTDADLDSLDFSTDEKAAKSINLLTGEQVDEFEFYTLPENQFHNTTVYRSLQNNSLVVALQDALDQGAQSLTDLIRHLFPDIRTHQFSMPTPEKLLGAYLEAIAFLNQKAGHQGKPLMDYRIHVLVKNITGHLKACPVCDAYYSSDLSFCPHDGYPLFAVYRGDIRWCIGKFSHHRLSPTLESESTDSRNVLYVLIARKNEETGELFDLAGNFTRDGIFEIIPDGHYRLAPLDAQNFAQIQNNLIWLSDPKSDYSYLYHLVKILLQSYEKCLGFVDSRALASRYSAILQDEFANEFLQEFVRLFYPRERQLDLVQTLEFLLKKAASVETSNLENAVFAELALWYHRYIAIPERMGGVKGLLTLKDSAHNWQELPILHKELLNIFIRERALCLNYSDDMPKSRFIRFQKYWATGHYGIYIDDTLSNNPLYRGITLSQRSIEYADFVSEWSAQDIQLAVDELVEMGILTRQTSPDSKTAYYLNMENLCFNLTSGEFGEGEDGYDRLKKQLLFVAKVHSSDLQATERVQIEKDLKHGETHFVAATPTLEMGIDIGDLETVLMIGAPPTPANYAQRAGRAGRGKKHEALIVTFCRGDNAHDMYAFYNPKQVINGQVSPPAFNPKNPDLVKKHINAFVLRHHIRNRNSLRQFTLEADVAYRSQLPQLQRVFGNQFPYEEYLDELKQAAENALVATDGKRVSLAHYCYSTGIFPDYGFRRDQVIAVDVDDKDKLDLEQTLEWNDYALTTRDLEQAFWFFVPEQTIYVAGEVYETLNDGIYELLPDGARQYSCFWAKKEIRFAEWQGEIKRFDMRRHFAPAPPDLVNKKNVLAIGYTDQCQLSFRNHGVLHTGKQKSEVERPLLLGYDLKREAVVLRFDAQVCDEVLRNSLVAILVREISENYGLASGEIRLMLDAKLATATDDRWIYVLLYDNDGNNNLPLKRIPNDFDMLIQRAAQRLAQCECATDGCYDCIKSYDMQRYAQTISKDRAEMFAGFLLGERRFEPSVMPFHSAQPASDLMLSVRLRNNEVVVTSDSGKVLRQSIQGSPNDAIFSTLTEAVDNEHHAGMSALRIETWVEWLAEAINSCNVNKGKEAFNRFQYALLRFQRVEAFYRDSKGK